MAKRVIVRPVEAETKTAAGIFIPDSAKEKPQVGDVLEVGKEVEGVKVGDRILHEEYGPRKFKSGNEELLVVKDEDILAVIK